MWIGPDGEMPEAQTIGPSTPRASISCARRSLQVAASVVAAAGSGGVHAD